MQEETRAEFHARRAKGIGGSDIGVILGLSEYNTPEGLWEEKVGIRPGDDSWNADKERGIAFETLALQRFERRTGYAVTRIAPSVHPDHPWMLASTDAMAIIEGEEVVAEVKVPSLGKFSRIKREGLPYTWQLQGQWYMMVKGWKKVVFVIFCPDRMADLHFIVEENLEQQKMIFEAAREFWTLVENMTPPKNVIREVQDQQIVVVGEVEKRIDPAFTDAVQMYKEARDLLKNAETVKEDAEQRVREVVGEDRRGVFEAPGIGRVHIKIRDGKRSFNQKALINAKPLDRISVATKLSEVLSGPMPEQWVIEAVGKVMSDTELDLSQFITQGEPYEHFQLYSSHKGED